jgi:hypothetical protein
MTGARIRKNLRGSLFGIEHFSEIEPMTETWLNAEAARAYVGCKTLKGWYEWRRRYGVVKRQNGTVNRFDLDRALRVRAALPQRIRGGGHTRHPNSLANLRPRDRARVA